MASQVRCPICQSPMNFQARSEWPDFPFCSLKCKRVDLNRWFKESYRLEASGSRMEEEGDQNPAEEPPEKSSR